MMTLKKKCFDEEIEIVFKINKYCVNDSLCIEMLQIDEDGSLVPWSILTVNFSRIICKENCAFVDVNNNADIVKWIIDNNLGTLTGKAFTSGYCTYPEVRFNMDEVRKYTVLLEGDNGSDDSDEPIDEAAAYREFEEDIAKSIGEGAIKFVPEGVIDFFEKMPADFIARFLDITTEILFLLSPAEIRYKIAETYIQMPYDEFKMFIPELRDKMKIVSNKENNND